MSRHLRRLSAVGILSLILASPSLAQEEMVANPFYKFWSGSKAGSTAVHVERTKLSGPDGKAIPGGADEKRIASRVVNVNNDRVVVETIVTEQDLLGQVQAAPTRQIYPVKWKKSHLERIIVEDGSKSGEDTVKVGGKEIKCRTIAGTLKGTDGEQVEFKLWLSDDVPGTIVKQVRTTRNKDDVIAETTSTLQSFKKAE